MAAYSFIVVGLSQVAGSFVAGAVARAFGVAWAIGGGGALMLCYAIWAFRSPNALPGISMRPLAQIDVEGESSGKSSAARL